MKRFAALLCLTLNACAVTYEPQPGADVAGFNDALLDCETRFAAIQDGWARQGYVHRCMAGKGFRRTSGW